MSADQARAFTLRKFNPGAMQSDEEIARQFVVRGHQLNTIMNVLRDNLDASSNQHLLLVAPRGRGKTMLLARVAAELRMDRSLAKRLLPVRFMEESMEVLGIADFWLECLLHLANALSTSHPDRAAALRASRAELASIMDDKTLEQRARAAVLDVADALDRRLVLMLENLQDLASDAGEDFGWQLRKVLQHEPRIMVIATATSRFATLDQADKSFFETFREISLPALSNGECRQLWQAATGDAIGEREITPLSILTGGSPRLLIFIAGFSNHHSMRQLMEELVTLIDDHTEYFRGHLDALPAKERRAYIALIDLWQPSTAREVAGRARMDIRTASSLLGRLVSRGAVTVDDQSAKRKTYVAAERLYSIYYKLRRERNEAAVVQGLVRFMAVFYTGPDLQSMVRSILDECREVEGIRQGLRLAMTTDSGIRERLISYMSFEDVLETLGEQSDAVEWARSRDSLAFEDYSRQKYESALARLNEIVGRFGDAEETALKEEVARALVNRGVVLAELERWEEALGSYAEVTDRFGNAARTALKESVAGALVNRGGVLRKLGRREDALASYAEVIGRFGDGADAALKKWVARAFLSRGVVLDELERREEALASFAGAIDRFGDATDPAVKEWVARALVNRGAVLGKLDRREEALDSCAEVIDRFGDATDMPLKEQVAMALVNRGVNLGILERQEEALASYAEVIDRFGDAVDTALKEPVARAFLNRGVILGKLDRPEEALANVQEVVERFADAGALELQLLIARALGRTWIDGNPETTARLYSLWYRGVPITNPDTLRSFQWISLMLLEIGVPATDLIDLLESNPEKRDQVFPLIVALRLEAGQDVRVPAEVLEVAEDVRKQLIELRAVLQKDSSATG